MNFLSFSPKSLLIFLATLFLFFQINNSNATPYVWAGTTTLWSTSTNWSPNGVPSTSDNVTINTAQTVVLDMDRSITNLTISAGTLDLGGFTLTFSGTATFTSGSIINGTIKATAGTSATFSGTAFSASAIVDITCTTILINGSSFAGNTTIKKTGGTSDTGNGGATFNGTTTIAASGAGSLRMGNSAGDIFNADVTFTNSGAGGIYPAYTAAGTQFNGDIYVNSSSSGGVRFGQNATTASGTLATLKKIYVGGAGFTTGELRFRYFTQTLGIAQGFTLTGTALLQFQTGCTFNDNLTVVSPQIGIAGSTFNGVTSIEKNGATGNNCTGGNTFNNTTTIKNSSGATLSLETATGDIFAANVTFINSGTLSLSVADNGSGGSATQFNGDIHFDNSSTGSIQFGANSTPTAATLASGKNLVIDAFPSGTLRFRKFTSSSAQNITLTGTTTTLQFQTGSSFETMTCTAPQLLLDGATFNGTTSFTKTGSGSSNNSIGGNTFNGATTFTNNGTSGALYLATSTADDFNGNVTFLQMGVGGALNPAYAVSSNFSGNISTTGTAVAITFGLSGAGTGRVIIDGSGNQVFSGDVGTKPIIKRLTMATTGSGNLTLNVPIDIGTSSVGDLTMTDGIINTTSTNFLTITDEAVTVNTGDANSFVDGPFKYTMSSTTANTVLNLPLGDGIDWRPAILTLTHGAATAYTYTAELKSGNANDLGFILSPSDFDHVSYAHYYDISRSSAANLTSAKIKMFFSCQGHDDVVRDESKLGIAKDNGSGSWSDIGGTPTNVASCSSPSTDKSGEIESGNFTSFSKFSLGARPGGDNPLPVELVYLEATIENSQVTLKWKTASEYLNDYFTLEKSSDCINFSLLDTVKGAGVSSTVNEYSTNDPNLLTGVTYYRLKQTDFNGTTTILKTVSVNFEGLEIINTLPNPAVDKIEFVINSSEDMDATYSIVDMNGHVAKSERMVFLKGVKNLQIDISSLAQSMYVFKLRSDNNKFYTRKHFIKSFAY